VERVAQRKIHFAPLARQERAIKRLLREGRYRNVSQLMRQALDCYLDRVGRPSLTVQARQMSEDFRGGERGTASLQDASRSDDETW
jgi:Arc/MetJ-type ribon-helix-helix transcriptional regulator